MQLTKSTCEDMGVSNPFDVEENINGGTKWLSERLEEFNGDIALVLASYNCGSMTVRKYNSIPPFVETQRYVENVLKDYEEYKENKKDEFIEYLYDMENRIINLENEVKKLKGKDYDSISGIIKELNDRLKNSDIRFQYK